MEIQRKKNPFGKSLVFVALDKKKIIATFSIIPLNYSIKKRIFKGACSIAMMVHPKYQNAGLIKFVADKLFEKAKKIGIDFVYGYPNSKAYGIIESYLVIKILITKKCIL